MGAVEIGLLVLLAFVFVFGVGVVVANRRKSRGALRRRRRSSAPPVSDSPAKSGTILEERTAAEAEADADARTCSNPSRESRSMPEPAPGTLRDRLAKARSTFAGAIAGVLGRSGITDESFEDLEEALLRADVGVGITDELLDGLRAKVEGQGDHRTDRAARCAPGRDDEPAARAPTGRSRSRTRGDNEPNVWMFVGVNGVGKTTTIGKLANQQTIDGRSVLLAAGDTFRAAAAEQLTRGPSGRAPSSCAAPREATRAR